MNEEQQDLKLELECAYERQRNASTHGGAVDIQVEIDLLEDATHAWAEASKQTRRALDIVEQRVYRRNQAWVRALANYLLP